MISVGVDGVGMFVMMAMLMTVAMMVVVVRMPAGKGRPYRCVWIEAQDQRGFLAFAVAFTIAEFAVIRRANTFHMVVMALLGSSHLCLEPQNLRAVLAHLAVHGDVA